MSRRSLSFCFALVTTLAVTVAQADPSQPDIAGFRWEPHIGPPCSVAMSIDRERFIAAVPKLKEIGMLNAAAVTDQMVNEHPNTLLMVFSLEEITAMVMQVYKDNHSIDRCSFAETENYLDEYGNGAHRDVLRFQFDRSLFKRINWDNFEAQNLMKVAPHFEYDQGFQSDVDAEAAQPH